MKAVLAILLLATWASMYGWLRSAPTMRRSAIALAAFLLLTTAAALPTRAQDVRVIDGATFEMDGEIIRLWGIDAPEPGGACGFVAKTSARILNRLVTAGFREGMLSCELPPDGQDRDRDGRLMRVCSFPDMEINETHVGAGLAWDWPLYSGGAYAEQEREARAAAVGVWSEHLSRPCPPPDWWQGE